MRRHLLCCHNLYSSFQEFYGLIMELKVYILLCCLFICLGQTYGCRSVITINKSAEDCRTLSVNASEMNKTCNDLQGILLQIAQSDIESDCFEVTLLPGKYIISERIHIQRNILIRGVSPVEVSFEGYFDTTLTREPLYVLSIANTSFAEISGITFRNSPGIVAFVNVLNVLVHNSNFR